MAELTSDLTKTITEESVIFLIRKNLVDFKLAIENKHEIPTLTPPQEPVKDDIDMTNLEKSSDKPTSVRKQKVVDEIESSSSSDEVIQTQEFEKFEF